MDRSNLLHLWGYIETGRIVGQEHFLPSVDGTGRRVIVGIEVLANRIYRDAGYPKWAIAKREEGRESFDGLVTDTIGLSKIYRPSDLKGSYPSLRAAANGGAGPRRPRSAASSSL